MCCVLLFAGLCGGLVGCGFVGLLVVFTCRCGWFCSDRLGRLVADFLVCLEFVV